MTAEELLESLDEVIQSRQTVRFELATNREAGWATVYILGPPTDDSDYEYLIIRNGLPSNWMELLESAIEEWYTVTGTVGKSNPKSEI